MDAPTPPSPSPDEPIQKLTTVFGLLDQRISECPRLSPTTNELITVLKSQEHLLAIIKGSIPELTSLLASLPKPDAESSAER